MAIRLPAPQIRTRISNAKSWLESNPAIIQADKTPYTVIYEEDIVKLRYYPPLQEDSINVMGETVTCGSATHRVPLLIVAPLAVNTLIYDWFADRSLIKFLRAKGFELYLVDWGKPTGRHNHYTLSTYFADFLPRLIKQVREHSGSQDISLHGWSFGGLFSYCYTALSNDKHIKNMVLVGAPCDYHANGPLGEQYQRISKGMRWLNKKTGWTVYKSPASLWRSPGWANSMAFKMTSPINSIKGYVDLVKNLNNTNFVGLHATSSAFLDKMVAYPGGVMQDIMHYLWTKNVLAKNQLPMASNADFANIKSNILYVNGRNDTIVLPECTEPLQHMVNSKDQESLLVSGGHVGIVSGSKAPLESWPVIADWLAKRSK